MLAALLLTCAMCANPDGAPADAPQPVVAVHDFDEARATDACMTVALVVGTERCAVLPPPIGLEPPADGVIVTVYEGDPDAAEADKVALNAAYGGKAIVRICSPEDAPPAPYAVLPHAPFRAAGQ